MIDELMITNIVTGKSITLNKQNAPYILDVVDWDSPDMGFSSYRVPNQVGEFLTGVTVGTRKPQIVGYVIADTTAIKVTKWEQYLGQQEKVIEETKLELDKVISVYQDVVISVGECSIKGRPTHPPKYSVKESDNNEVLCLFTLDFICSYPMFLKGENEVRFAWTEDKFHFPLVMEPETKRVVFGAIHRLSASNLDNNGDAPTGMVIVIKADTGVVADPKVSNLTTGEYLGFANVTMQVGDIITINTNVGEESAVWHKASDSVDVSIIGNITTGSTFLKVNQGADVFVFDVGEEYKLNADMSIKYSETYYNIRGM